LVHYFLRKFSRIYKQPEKSIHQDALLALQGYRWPGNVRELENVMQRAFVVSKGDIILGSDLPSEVTGPAAQSLTRLGKENPQHEASRDTAIAPRESGVEPSSNPASDDIDAMLKSLFHWARHHPELPLMPMVERELVRQALREVQGNQVKAARLLGMTRATLRKRIEKFDIRQEINVD